MRKKIKKIFILLTLVVFATIFLVSMSGCKKAPVPEAIIISAPEKEYQVSKTYQNKYSASSVYLLYRGGGYQKLKEDLDFTYIIDYPTQIEGVQGYKNVRRIRAKHYQTEMVSEPVYFVYNAESAILPKPLLNIRYEQVNEQTRLYENKGFPNNKNQFIFLTRYGQKYDMDSLLGTTSSNETDNEEIAETFKERGLFITALATNTGKATSHNIYITKDNIYSYENEEDLTKQKELSDEQLKMNSYVTRKKDENGNIELDVKPVYPSYYGKTKGIKQGLTKEYRMYLEFDTTNLREVKKYEKGKSDEAKEELLDLGLGKNEKLVVSHPVFSVGTKSERPVNKQAANWFDYILVIPIASIMWLFGFGGSLGAAIFFTTIIVRTIAWPIYAKTNDMSQKMQEAQPELKKIQDKYRGATDKASQRAMQMEIMRVYQKHKIGFSVLLLPFAQMPIFIGMFQALRRVFLPDGFFSAKFTRITNTMGFIDLTQGGLRYMGKFNWITFILAVLVGVTMWLLQFLGSKKPAYLKGDPNQEETEEQKKSQRTGKIISYVMLFMMVIFSFQSNAVAFYWIIGNLYSIAQSYIQKAINKRKYLKKHQATGLEVK